jgi:hypothetical protein
MIAWLLKLLQELCSLIPVYRAALGELSDRGLYEIFQSEFGAANSPAFEAARRNFIVSEAGYAIASYLLQVKLLKSRTYMVIYHKLLNI